MGVALVPPVDFMPPVCAFEEDPPKAEFVAKLEVPPDAVPPVAIAPAVLDAPPVSDAPPEPESCEPPLVPEQASPNVVMRSKQKRVDG